MSYYAKLRFISRHGRETLYIAQIQHFLRAVNGDGHMLRVAVCELYGASYGLPGMRASEDIMTASLQSSQPRPVLACVGVSTLDTELATAKADKVLYGFVYKTPPAWHRV